MGTASVELKPAMAEFPTSNAARYKRVAGTNSPVGGLYYDATTSQSAFWDFVAVAFASGNPVVTVEWYADTATSGGVVWEVAIAAITPNTDSQDVETKSFATAQSASDTHLGTTGQRLHSVDVTVTNLDSLAAGDEVTVRIARLPADGSDTLTGDAVLRKAVLAYTT